MGNLISKSKPVTCVISNESSQDECGSCRSGGKVSCAICQSKGFVKKFKAEQQKCDVCSGTGTMSSSCISCSGTGTATRRLKYEEKGGQAAIEQRGILMGAKRTQIVSVVVKNTDDIVGKYTVVVTLRDGRSTSSKGTVNLRPGESSPVALSFFPVMHKDGYPASYEIIPEEVEVACKACNSQGRIEKTCASCQGIGQARIQRESVEVCVNCSGAGEVRCKKCNGTGRIKS